MKSKAAGHLRRGRTVVIGIATAAALVACQTTSMGPQLDAADSTPPKRTGHTGHCDADHRAEPTKCAYTHPKMNVRVAAVGEITATDGTVR